MEFNIKVRANFKKTVRARMGETWFCCLRIEIVLMYSCALGIWEAMELLNTLVDESDPDVSDNVALRTLQVLTDLDS